MPIAERFARRFTRGAAVALLALTLAGCAVQLIAPYDPQTDMRLTDWARTADSFFDWAAEVRPTYPQARSAHESLKGDLRVIVLRAEARDHNDLTLEQLRLLGEIWSGVERMHQDGPLSPDVIEISRGIVARGVQACIRLELEKTRKTK
jgi:hypothetical protein